MSDSPLDHSHYDLIFEILTDCEGSYTVSEFRARLLESLSRRLHVHHAGVLLGGDRASLFEDGDAVTLGATSRLLEPYAERYHRFDPIAYRASLRRPVLPLRLSDVAAGRLPAHERFVEQFLIPQGIRDVVATELTVPGLHVGWYCKPLGPTRSPTSMFIFWAGSALCWPASSISWPGSRCPRRGWRR
ncbi:hypothetical protein GCM10027589_00720 [Actinocorallia lasiicapitis]